MLFCGIHELTHTAVGMLAEDADVGQHKHK